MSGSLVIFLVLYVDDILLIGNDILMLNYVKSSLSRVFSMEDLDGATYILGIRIFHEMSKRLISLSQNTYIRKVLERFNMQDSKRSFLHISYGISLSESQCPRTREQIEKMKMVSYVLAIGSIMYVILCTRPDISYALSMTSRYQKDPGDDYWLAVKNILKYLRMTKDLILIYDGEEHLTVMGYMYILNDGAVC
jgi:Reverse transcriptase (RNA-dependent DNA polymerase)